MDVTITFGLWVIPTVITAICLGVATWFSRGDGRPDTYGVSGLLILLFFWCPAIVVSLTVWLIYALVT